MNASCSKNIEVCKNYCSKPYLFSCITYVLVNPHLFHWQLKATAHECPPSSKEAVQKCHANNIIMVL